MSFLEDDDKHKAKRCGGGVEEYERERGYENSGDSVDHRDFAAQNQFGFVEALLEKANPKSKTPKSFSANGISTSTQQQRKMEEVSKYKLLPCTWINNRQSQ